VRHKKKKWLADKMETITKGGTGKLAGEDEEKARRRMGRGETGVPEEKENNART